MSDLLAGRWETNTEDTLWREEIKRRLDDLEQRISSGKFRPDQWYPIGRFNSVHTNDVFVGLVGGTETIRINDAGFKINNTGDNSVYMNFYNSSITDYPLAKGFVNLQAAAPDASAHGTMNVGFEGDANSQAVTYWCLAEIDHLIKSGGNWRYVQEMFYDYMNFNTVIRVAQLAADPVSNLDNGDIYYNTTTNKFRGYENGSWQNLI